MDSEKRIDGFLKKYYISGRCRWAGKQYKSKLIIINDELTALLSAERKAERNRIIKVITEFAKRESLRRLH